TGPLSVPLFLFYGLSKGAFLATEAASSLGLYFSKSVTFERFGALTADVALKGLVAGSSLMFGAFIAKRFVLHLKPEAFRLIMDAIMLAPAPRCCGPRQRPEIPGGRLARPEPFGGNRRPSDARHSKFGNGTRMNAGIAPHCLPFQEKSMIRGATAAAIAGVIVLL